MPHDLINNGKIWILNRLTPIWSSAFYINYLSRPPKTRHPVSKKEKFIFFPPTVALEVYVQSNASFPGNKRADVKRLSSLEIKPQDLKVWLNMRHFCCSQCKQLYTVDLRALHPHTQRHTTPTYLKTVQASNCAGFSPRGLPAPQFISLWKNAFLGGMHF